MQTTLQFCKCLKIVTNKSFSSLLSKSHKNYSSDANEGLKYFLKRRKKIDIDGVMINWDRIGQGEHVVLCLPGVFGESAQLIPLLSKFDKSKFTIVSCDFPALLLFCTGYGLSIPPLRDFSGNFMQRDSRFSTKLMEILGYNYYSLMGFSTGAVIGFIMAGTHPERIRKIFVWSSGYTWAGNAAAYAQKRSKIENWRPESIASLIELYGEKYFQQQLHGWSKALTEYEEKGYNKIVHECHKRTKAPTYIVHGEDDPVIPLKYGKLLHESIKNSRFYMIPKGSHTVHLTHTDLLADMAEKFFTE